LLTLFAQFKVDSLTQQLQLSQAESTRLSEELSNKSEELTKYRRTRQTEISTLQANYDSLTETHNTTQASLKALQSAHNAQTQQLTQALSKVQTLTGQLAEQESIYSTEASTLKRLIRAMEEREQQAKDVVDRIEKEWADMNQKADMEVAAAKEQLHREMAARDEAEKKAERLEMVLQKVGQGELPIPADPSRVAEVVDQMTDGMLGLSPTVAMASRVQKTGKTFTEVYADYVKLQEDYRRKCAEYDNMDSTLKRILGQIEERVCIHSSHAKSVYISEMLFRPLFFLSRGQNMNASRPNRPNSQHN
jgi:nucleoprotein TPR